MLERSQRPLDDDDRRILEGYRRSSAGGVRLDPGHTLLGGALGLIAGFIWLIVKKPGGPGAPEWPFAVIVGLTAAGAALGFCVDSLRARRARRQRAAAAERAWAPVFAVGVVERVVAEAARAVRLDDGADTAWFLEVGERQILCVWDWADDARARVEVDLVPGTPPTVLKISWAGQTLAPLRPKRKLKRSERRPELGEMIEGRLEDLDALLDRGAATTKRAPAGGRPGATDESAARLADAVEPLGFYKHVAAGHVVDAKAQIARGGRAWYAAAERAFGADAEELAEGGVKDLLDYMRPALAAEGCALGEIDQSYDRRAYVLRIGGAPHTMWTAAEAARPRAPTWKLTTERAAGLINQLLADAGSDERVHVLNGGEDAVFVLLTPALREAIVRSDVLDGEEIPAPFPRAVTRS